MWCTRTLFLTGISSESTFVSHFLPLKSKSPPLDCPFWIRCSPPLPSNLSYFQQFLSAKSQFFETCLTLEGAVPKLSWSCFASESLRFSGIHFKKRSATPKSVANFRWIRMDWIQVWELTSNLPSENANRSPEAYACHTLLRTCRFALREWSLVNTKMQLDIWNGGENWWGENMVGIVWKGWEIISAFWYWWWFRNPARKNQLRLVVYSHDLQGLSCFIHPKSQGCSNAGFLTSTALFQSQ